MASKDKFTEKCKVSIEQIKWLAANTIDQRPSFLWGKFRSLWFTGSNFGEGLEAINRNRSHGHPFPPFLFKKLMGEYYFSTKDSIIWGQMHEKVALNCYKELTGNHVQEIGIPCGFLESSPDGIVTNKDTEKEGDRDEMSLEI